MLNAKGDVVRHLAAGVLGLPSGKSPPPAPLQAGLAQELTWDGKDDFGKPAGVGGQGSGVGKESPNPDPRNPTPAFKVRVRTGLQLTLGAYLASDPLYVCYPEGMATDDDGNMYFLSSSAAGGLDFHSLRVFNRKGDYLRTIMPMPGDLPAEKAKLFDVIDTGGGRWIPRNRCGTWPDFYRKVEFGTGNVFQLANRVGKDGIVNLCNNGSLLRMNTDGSPAGTDAQPIPWFPAKKRGRWAPIAGYFNVAVSPDGSRVYASGLNSGLWKQKRIDPDFPAGRILVYSDKATKTFADVKLGDKGPKEGIPRVNMYDVEGMSCDGQGNLFVCDPTNGVVRVFDPTGKEINSIAVENAFQVACHRKSGEVYVLCVTPGYARAAKVIRKFSSLKDGAKELASFPLPDTGEGACMALDDTGEAPIIWAAIRAGHVQFTFGGPARVFRLEDKGDSFAETKHPIVFDLDGVKERVAVHPETELVIHRGQYTEAGAVNGLTGEKVALPFKKCMDMAPGQDGNWYINQTGSYCGYVCKYDKDLKPIDTNTQVPPENPKGKPPANAVGWAFGKYGWGISATGLAADNTGRLFAHQLGNTHVNAGYFVIAFSPDGKAEDHPWAKDHPTFKGWSDKEYKCFNSAIVALDKTNGAAMQLDVQGNLYVGAGLVPVDFKPPAGHEKDPAMIYSVGSVIKFPKGGGQCVDLPATQPGDKKGLVLKRQYWPVAKVFAENATAVYPDLGSIAGGLPENTCSCRHPMFHVDGFGRLAIPNAITFSVRLLDNAGNEIMRFGKYGNIDAIVAPLKAAQEKLAKDDPLRIVEVNPAKPEGINVLLKALRLPASDASFGWPEAVAASERAVYVADVYNHCVVRLDKQYASDAVLDVK